MYLTATTTNILSEEDFNKKYSNKLLALGKRVGNNINIGSKNKIDYAEYIKYKILLRYCNNQALNFFINKRH
jgi:hypothetical protein